MARPLRLRSATRRRLIWLLALLMLWQQVALAACVCQLAPETTGRVMAMPSAPSMPAMDCNCPDMHRTSVGGHDHNHCAPDQVTQVDAHQTSVPPSALAALPPMLLSYDVVALQSDRILARLSHRRTSPPDPRLLFCSLLI